MSVKSDSILHEVHGEKTIPTIYHNAMLSEIKTLTAQNQKYREALEKIAGFHYGDPEEIKTLVSETVADCVLAIVKGRE